MRPDLVRVDVVSHDGKLEHVAAGWGGLVLSGFGVGGFCCTSCCWGTSMTGVSSVVSSGGIGNGFWCSVTGLQ